MTRRLLWTSTCLLLALLAFPRTGSAGIGEIVSAYASASRDGGHLKLVNLTKRIHDLLVITKLVTLLETFDTEAEAVRSFPAAAV